MAAKIPGNCLDQDQDIPYPFGSGSGKSSVLCPIRCRWLAIEQMDKLVHGLSPLTTPCSHGCLQFCQVFCSNRTLILSMRHMHR